MTGRDRRLELSQRAALGQIALGTGGSRARTIARIVGRRQDHDANVRQAAADHSRRLQPVDDRHREIHQDAIRFERECEANPFCAVACAADDLDLLAATYREQDLAVPAAMID